jgi:hypothetical protein
VSVSNPMKNFGLRTTPIGSLKKNISFSVTTHQTSTKLT